jgi:arabinan endo-1,5-alpha-L-arabinosidase
MPMLLLLCLADLFGFSQTAEQDGSMFPRNAWRGRDSRAHDPSTIVKCGNEYWVFATGWGVKSLRSRDLQRWEAGPPVFTNFPAWTREVVPEHRGNFWAPDVIRVDDRYRVYYSVSSWGKNDSAIGLASNATLDPSDPAYAWRDDGLVIRSRRDDNFNAIDPNVVRERDGRLWLAFGSFWSGIKLVELDPATGRRLETNSPLHSLAHHEAIEAPCVYPHDDFCYLFVNWGQCCRGTNSTYEIRVGRSPRITGPYLDRDGNDMLHGGGTLFLATSGRFIGPGHAAIFSERGTNWLSYHYYDGANRGMPTLRVRPLVWDSTGWPSGFPD